MKRFFLILWLLVQPTLSFATDVNAALAEGQKLLAAKNYPALDSLLTPMLAEDKPHLEALFLAGMSAVGKGDYQAAANYFRAMLARDPGLIRPRLELARALQLAGERESARYHYEQVLSAPLPDTVRRNIYRQLNDIRSRTPSLKLSLELSSDTNPKQTTSSKEVIIGGKPYILTDVNQGQVMWGLAMTADMMYPLAVDPSWFIETYGLAYEYPGRELDSTYGLATLGKRIERGQDEYTLSAGGQVSAYQDRSQYTGAIMHATGLWVMTPQFAWKGDASIKTYRYSRLPFLNGELSALSGTATMIPNPARRWDLGASMAHYSASEDPYTYWQTGLNVHVSQEWTGGWITGLRAQALKSNYKAPDPFFGRARRDAEGRMELEVLNRKLRWAGFSPQLLVGYVKRASNLDLYAYDRFYSRIGLSTSF